MKKPVGVFTETWYNRIGGFMCVDAEKGNFGHQQTENKIVKYKTLTS